METGGGYVRSMAGDLDLDILYFDGIKQKTEAQTLKSGKIKVYEEHFNLFILTAFFLLLFEELLDGKRRANTKRKFSFFIVVLAIGLTPWLCLSPVEAAETPDELYQQGRYEEAEQAYSQQDMDHPKDIRFRYNRGCAAFQNGQYEEASAAFSSVIRRTENEDVRFKAAFNLGNTAFKQGDYASASTYYKQALADQPASEDARYNLELSLRALKKEQEKQEQEPADTPQSDTPPQGNDQEGTDNQKPGEQQPDKEPQQSDKGNEDPQENEDHQKTEDPTSGDDKNQTSAQNKPPESIDEDTPSGDLKPREALPELESTDPLKGDNPSDIDRIKAEALLDNIQEDPSEIMRFMLSDENRQNSFSGRDW